MKSSEKSLLYEIKERVVRIEEHQKAVSQELIRSEAIMKTRLEGIETDAKNHSIEDEGFQQKMIVAFTKYDSYFKIRNEIKNWAVMILIGACGSMLTYILLK